MTFAAAITTIAERFLTDRSFELIVAPALADFEFDADTASGGRVAARASVIIALLGAFRDDAMRSGDIATFAGLLLIPVCYYSFFFILGLPKGMPMASGPLTALFIAVVALSLAPVLVCYWPDRQPRKPTPEA